MTTPKKITEAQAQELANLLGCFIVVDKCREVNVFKIEPKAGKNRWYGFQRPFERWPDTDYQLPILIDSTRPWTEQIWRPE